MIDWLQAYEHSSVECRETKIARVPSIYLSTYLAGYLCVRTFEAHEAVSYHISTYTVFVIATLLQIGYTSIRD